MNSDHTTHPELRPVETLSADTETADITNDEVFHLEEMDEPMFQPEEIVKSYHRQKLQEERVETLKD